MVEGGNPGPYRCGQHNLATLTGRSRGLVAQGDAGPGRLGTGTRLSGAHRSRPQQMTQSGCVDGMLEVGDSKRHRRATGVDPGNGLETGLLRRGRKGDGSGGFAAVKAEEA